MSAVAAPPEQSGHGVQDQVAPPGPRHAAATAAPSGRSLVPTVAEWVDLCALLVLLCLAVLGFGKAYGGTQYFAAGVIGSLLGAGVAFVCARKRQPTLVVAAAVAVVFFLFGGAVAVPEQALAGIFPTPGTITALTDGLVQGWVKLLTTLPPVGSSANLLTVPYVCGLVGAVLSISVALRTRLAFLAVVPPTAVLALSILFGTSEPTSLLLQGTAFAVVAIAWLAVRQRRDRRSDVQFSSSRRRGGALLMLVVAAVVSWALGGSLPGATSNPRFVLRDQVEPPFDPREHPSPLNGYRNFTDPGALRDKTVMTVDGVEAGDRFRLATLDSYDGVVYSVGSGPGSSGYFQRVGESIPVDSTGEERKVEVTVGEYSDVWLPTLDGSELRSIEFLSRRSEQLDDTLRYNLSTGTAVVQSRLRPGDRYRLDVVDRALDMDRARSAGPARVDQPDPHPVPAVEDKAGEYAGDADTPYARASRIAERLRDEGALSDGQKAVKEHAPARPGHGQARLSDMVDQEQGLMVGNGEQYAPLAALMSRSVGAPARVVMGFEVDQGLAGDRFEVKGEHVTAWIEVAVDGVGWVPVRDVVPDDIDAPQQPQPEPVPQPVTPPPPPPPVPPSEDDETETNRTGDDDRRTCEQLRTALERDPGEAEREEIGDQIAARCAGGGIPWGTIAKVGGVVISPFVIVAAFTGAIAAVKARRRLRRRTRGAPTERVAGGWTEVTDLACDLGSPVPRLATRKEAAAMIGNPVAVELAAHADGNIFGPASPDAAHVERYWDEVDRTRAAMLGDRTPFERWKAIVSLASLRAAPRPRLRRPAAATPTRSPRVGPTDGTPAVTVLR